MQSAKDASRDSRFPIASTKGFVHRMSWLVRCQWSLLLMILMTSGDTAERPAVFLRASGRRQIDSSSALNSRKPP